jgi:hypothetical protein
MRDGGCRVERIACVRVMGEYRDFVPKIMKLDDKCPEMIKDAFPGKGLSLSRIQDSRRRRSVDSNGIGRWTMGRTVVTEDRKPPCRGIERPGGGGCAFPVGWPLGCAARS